MKISDVTIGLRNLILEEAATAIYERFGYSFVARTSSFLGGDYYAAVGSREEVLVHLNRDGEEIAEEAHPECAVLLQINSCDDANRWKSVIPELDGVLIRENEYESSCTKRGLSWPIVF